MTAHDAVCGRCGSAGAGAGLGEYLPGDISAPAGVLADRTR